MRERFIGELAEFASADQLTEWAYRALPIKNRLTVEDARMVEEAFHAKLDEIANIVEAEQSSTPAGRTTPEVAGLTNGLAQVAAPSSQLVTGNTRHDVLDNSGGSLGGGIDKSVLTISEPRRYRDKVHLKFVASQACLVCGRQPSDPHHLRFAQPRALSRKVSDEFTVPLCRTHHREVHRTGNEAGWWNKVGIEPQLMAAALWMQTRPVRSVGEAANPDQSTVAQATTSDAIAAPGLRNGTRIRKTKPMITAGAQ